MADENGNGDGGEGQGEGGGESGDDRGGSRSSARDDRRRENLTRRATEAEARATEAESRLSDIEDQLAEAQGKGGSLDKVVERLQSKLTKTEGERDDALANINGLATKRNTSGLIESLVTETGLSPIRVKGLLLAAKDEDPELDIAPERADKSLVKGFVKLLAEHDPESFQSSETGKKRPRPGPAPGAHNRGLDDGERSGSGDDAFLRHPVFQAPKDGRPI